MPLLLSCSGSSEASKPALRLVAPKLPLLERYPSDGTPQDRVKEAVFERINSDRKALGLAPVAWDEAASRVADDFCRRQLREETHGHYLTDGIPPYARTGLAGIFGMQAENAVSWESSSPFRESPMALALEGHEHMLQEKPPHDGHRRTILDPEATHVGVGYALEKREFRMAQEFLTRDLARLLLEESQSRKATLAVKGEVLASRWLRFVTLAWEPPPRPLTRPEASARRAYSYPVAKLAYSPEWLRGLQVIGAVTHPRIRYWRKGEFSFRFSPEQPGLWTMVFYTSGGRGENTRPGGSAVIWVE